MGVFKGDTRSLDYGSCEQWTTVRLGGPIGGCTGV